MRRKLTGIFPRHYSVDPSHAKIFDEETLYNARQFLLKIFSIVASQTLFTGVVVVVLNIRDNYREALFAFALSFYSYVVVIPLVLFAALLLLYRDFRNHCPLNALIYTSMVILSSIRTATLASRYELSISWCAFLLVVINMAIVYTIAKLVKWSIFFKVALFVCIYMFLNVYTLAYSITGLFVHAPALFAVLVALLLIACSVSMIFIFQFMHEVYYLVSEEDKAWIDTSRGSIIFVACAIYIMTLQLYYSYFFLLGLFFE